MIRKIVMTREIGAIRPPGKGRSGLDDAGHAGQARAAAGRERARMRIAVLSDVHGNLLALEAVLGALRQDSPDLIVNLGDCLSGPYAPAAAADLQMSLAALTIRGNHERGILDGADNRLDRVARQALSAPQLDWIARLPATAQLDELFLCHGSPAHGDEDSLLETITGEQLTLADPADVARKLAGIGPARVVLCGHTHVARAVLQDGVLVLNPGSVGMTAFRATQPAPFVVEAGSPHARYALLERERGLWSFQHRAAAYDWERAARQAAEHGFADVAAWTGAGRV